MLPVPIHRVTTQPPTVIDLDRVLLTPSVVVDWQRTIEAARPLLRGLPAAAIPIEQGRVWPDSRLQIVVTLPGNRGKVLLTVPPGQWAWQPGRA